MTWSAERVERLRDLASDGNSAGIIAKAMSLNRNQVIGKCFREGIALTGKGPRLHRGGGSHSKLCPTQIADVVAKTTELARAGHNCQAAAREMGVGRGHVRWVLEKHAPHILAALTKNGQDYSKRKPRTCKRCIELQSEVERLQRELRTSRRAA